MVNKLDCLRIRVSENLGEPLNEKEEKSRMDRKEIIPMVMAVIILGLVGVSVAPSVAATAYNRQNAVNYALTYAENPNSDYRYFSGADCTNFVSQCVYAGGWPKIGWNKYSSSHWFYNSYYIYSYTWTRADYFGKFLAIYSGRGFARSLSHHPWNQYFEIGDIVQADKDNNGKWDHTMIVTEVDGDEMYMTYHSSNTHRKALTQVISETRQQYPNAVFMGYHLEDNF